MKRLQLNRKQILRAIRAACLALLFGAYAPRSEAGTLNYNTSDFSVNGSAVTSIGSGDPSGAYFSDTSATSYNISIGGVSLGNSSSTYNNLLQFGAGSVSNTGTLTSSGSTIYIAGSGTVTNSGSITASNSGLYSAVYLGGSGTVNNLHGGSISGYYGVYLNSGGTVTNAGTITGTGTGSFNYNSTGVFVVGTGTVINAGTINSDSNVGWSIRIEGNGTVINSGHMYSGYGIGIDDTGTVTNSGYIGAYNGDALAMDGGTVTNTSTGLLYGSSVGVSIGSNGGTVTNAGTISGVTSGISISGTGMVTNSGTIISTGATSTAGAASVNNGTITNLAHGTISGYYGANIETTGTVNNYGTITGTGSSGSNSTAIEIRGSSGTVNNFAGGTITGSYSVYFINNGTLNNSGSISGVYAVHMGANGTVNNSGSITGSEYAIHIVNTGVVNNSGTLTSSGGNAIQIDDAGTVTNSSSGSITGVTGVKLGSGTVSNSGAITGTGGDGIKISGMGTVILAGGSVGGSTNALELNTTGGTASTVTVQGRTGLTYGNGNHGLLEDNGTGTLNLNLVGATPTEAAALKADIGRTIGTLLIGGETYDWSGLKLTGATAISLEQVVDPGLEQIATKIDNLTTPLPVTFDSFYLAALTDPEGALNTLTGREINNATDSIGVNQATDVIQTLNSHLDTLNVGGGMGGFDTSNLHISTASLLAFDNTSAQLESLMKLTPDATLEKSLSPTDEQTMRDMAPGTAGPQWGGWASGTVTLADQSSSSVPGYRATTGSPTVGIDFRVTPQLRVGALANYTTTGANFSDGSNLGAQTGLIGIYGTWKQNNWHINGVLAAGYTSYDINRSVFGATANSHPAGWEGMTDWTGGYDVNLNRNLRFTPELGLTYTHLAVDGHTESGAGAFDLALSRQNIDSLRSHLGGQLVATITDGGVTFLPEMHAAYYHEFLDNSSGVSESLPGAPALGSFSIQTGSPQRDFALVGFGLNTMFTGEGLPMAVFVDYNAQVGQANYIAHTVDGGMRVSF